MPNSISINKSRKKIPAKIAYKSSVLSKFLSQNPQAEIKPEKDKIYIEKPWGTKDTKITVTANDDELINALNNVILTTKYDAIIHVDTNVIEFMFRYVDPLADEYKDLIERKFTAYYEGARLDCHYGEPSDRLFKIAKASEKLPSPPEERSVPQIRAFIDVQNLENAPKVVKDFFKDKIPRNFFIKFGKPHNELDLDKIFKHLNFIASYYDRESPFIKLNVKQVEDPTANKAIRYCEEKFPDQIIIHPVDDILLQLIETGRKSEPRFAFIYYYQVLEYAAYYYVEEKIKNKVRSLLKDPTIISCGDEKFADFFGLLTDSNHSEERKMQKVVEENCDPKAIWNEIENDKDFFCSSHAFEGGFQFRKLIDATSSYETWKINGLAALVQEISKTRNVLVHIREKREHNVILPTIKNHKILKRLLPVISRLAEQIALKAG